MQIGVVPMAGGRPRIEIDWAEFDRLCEVQCTLAEIATHFGVSEDTIERAVKREHGVSFADYFAQKRQAGFVSLRRKQYELAMAGNATMLIFLGKQYLGQADKREVAAPEPITFTVEHIVPEAYEVSTAGSKPEMSTLSWPVS
jgi:hypothetical protein